MKTQSKSQKTGSQTIPDFAPGSISADTQRKYFENGAGPKIERNRWFFISLLLTVALIGCIYTFTIILPLKSVETYQVNKVEGGRLIAEGTPVGSWAPDSDSIAYHLNRWANSVFDINRSTIEQNIADSTEMTIGNATDQLRDLRSRDNPILLLKDTPELIRTYEYTSINFIKDDVALLRFKTITRVPGKKPKEVPYSITINFTRVKPKTKAQVMRNPAGLFVANFSLNEENISK